MFRFPDRRPPLLTALALLSLLGLPTGTGAQIVNIERLLASEPEPGLHGALEAGLGLQQGNSESFALNSSGLVRWLGGPHLLQVVMGGAYSEAQGNKVADHAMAHLRYGWVLTGRVRLEALYQEQRDAFVRLRRRVLLGAGARAVLLTRTPGEAGLDLDAGLILMHEQERLRDGESEPGWRASVLLSIGWSLGDHTSLGTQVYFQPRLDDVADHRILQDLGLGVQLLGPLSLRLDARLVHDSRPPDGVKPTDLSLRNALAITF